MAAVGELILFVIWVAVVVLWARIIIEWVQMLARSWRPRGVIAAFCEAIFTVTDPPLRAIRGVVRPVRLGGTMLDLSPLILLILLWVLANVVTVIVR